MKRVLEDEVDTPLAKRIQSPTYNTVVNNKSTNESPIDYSNLDLTTFETSPSWSDEYLTQINVKQHPYQFQIELVQTAIRQQNTIICLRTGAGKTHISALLIKYYYMRKMKSSNNKKFLAFFFVPHRAIREQQVTAVRNIGNLRVGGCDDESSAHDYMSVCDVIICTPQKFLNCLNDETISLNKIDLLIFDECHNSVGNHPYTQIMKFALLKHVGLHLPTIFGLTASCGTKVRSNKEFFEQLIELEKLPKTVQREHAVAHLYELCATMNCHGVCILLKQENRDELELKIHRPKTNEIITVQSIEFNHQLIKFKQMMKFLSQEIGGKYVANLSIDSQDYEQKLIEIKVDLEKKNDFEDLIKIKYLIMLAKRHHAITDIPLQLLITELIDRLDTFYKKKETPKETETEWYELCKKSLNQLREQLKDSIFYLTNPKLDRLVELIKNRSLERKDARGLILVQRTFYAKTIFDYLARREDTKDIVRPCWLVGQTGVDYQKTLNGQDETLKTFRSGQCNVIVSTNVVEEGLDVPQCSYVIRYEFVSNEIGTVQARGRARTENSSYYLLTDAGSKNYYQEMANRMKEALMEQALEKCRELSSNQLKNYIQIVQEKIIGSWKVELDKEKEIAKRNIPNGTLSCRSCGYYLGQIGWLRQRKTCHFVAKPKLLDRVEIELKAEPEHYKEIQVNGNILCGNTQCRDRLGGAQIFTDRPDIDEVCALQCKSLKFTYVHPSTGQEEAIIKKKWTDLPFPILELPELRKHSKREATDNEK